MYAVGALGQTPTSRAFGRASTRASAIKFSNCSQSELKGGPLNRSLETCKMCPIRQQFLLLSKDILYCKLKIIVLS